MGQQIGHQQHELRSQAVQIIKNYLCRILFTHMTFHDLNLNKPLLNALDEMGYTNPTTIQHRVFSVVMSGRDVCGIAQTGTGKTFAYLLPCLRLWKFSKDKSPQILDRGAYKGTGCTGGGSHKRTNALYEPCSSRRLWRCKYQYTKIIGGAKSGCAGGHARPAV